MSEGSERIDRVRSAPAGADRWALGIVAAGLALRAVALTLGVPATNSDEATVGLMALHIARAQEWPVWFYGQSYMGSLEAYLAAPLFALFGPSTGLLRLQTLGWYALSMWTVYRLARRVYSRRVALVTLLLLAFASDRVLKDQLIAGGGYPEIVPLAGLLMLGAAALAAGAGATARGGGRWAYAAWGFAAGLAVWDDWIVLPYLAAAGALLIAFRRRELLGGPGVLVLGGAVLGAAPMLLDNLTGRSNSVAVLLQLNSAGNLLAAGAGPAEHLRGGVLLGIPLVTGVCPPGECGPEQTWWAVAFVALLAVSGLLAAVTLGRLLRRRRTGAAAARHATRLALVVAAALTLVSYTRSPSAVLHPVESSRYLAILAVTLPAVLWPLLTAGRLSGLRRGWPRAVAAAAGGAVVVAVAALALSATAAVLRTAPAAADGERAQAELVAALDGAGVREVYSDYWTCNRLTFATRERIACAVVTATLGRGHDRYAAYRERVDGAPRAAYVLRRGSDELSSFERWRAAHAPGSERVATRDYLVYVVTERPDATRD